MGQLSILMWIKRIRHRDLHIRSNAPHHGAIHLGNNTGKENNYRIIMVLMLFILIGSDNMEVSHITIYDA